MLRWPAPSAMVLMTGLFALSAVGHAQHMDPTDIRACTAIESDSQRLICYDRASGRMNLPAAQKKAETPVTATATLDKDRSSQHASMQSDQTAAPPLSLLDSRWELSPDSKLGTGNIRGYKPIYVMPVFATSNQNSKPSSPNPDNTVSQAEQLQNVEMKFQLSLKTKVWQGVFGDIGDVWVGYTQSSRWQVYNKAVSRPFRETNYEPEALLVFNTNYQVLGWNGRMLGIGIDHQSNGQSNPLSRSWNRVMLPIGFDRDGWSVMVRPWWRIPEDSKTDDNPNISDYIGRGDVQIVREWNGQEFGLMVRHSLRGGSRSHGAGQFTWSFPLAGNLRGYMELFKGYGESMIDYNHNATYLGIGVSLLDWY